MHMTVTRDENGSSSYVLGYTESELARLALQAAFFAAETENILRQAGLQPGLRVLDLGCGIGDVSLAAARIVGVRGSVMGIDHSAEAIEMARRRSADEGLTWMEFAERSLDDLPHEIPFDAIIGRFILVHLPQPQTVLKQAVKLLKPNGILAFAELDIGSASISPPAALFQRCLDWITAVYRCTGLEPNMGSHLYSVFRSVGLTPALTATCRMTGGADGSALEYLAATVRSMLPALEAFGITDATGVGIDDLGDRLLAESAAGDHCIAFPRFVGAWSRVSA